MALDDAATREAAGAFLESISQAKQRIEQLELIFARQVYPAVEADLRKAQQDAEQQWLKEKQELQEQLDAERREKLSVLQELQTERERYEVECHEKNMLQSRLRKTEEELKEKILLMGSLHTRYLQLKRQHGSITRQVRVVEGIKAGNRQSEDEEYSPSSKKQRLEQPVNAGQLPEVARNGMVTRPDMQARTENLVIDGQLQDVTRNGRPEMRAEVGRPEEVRPEMRTMQRAEVIRPELMQMPEVRPELDKPTRTTPTTEPKKKGTLKGLLGDKWRTTRLKTDRVFIDDPHDDFLNTPRERALERIKQAAIQREQDPAEVEAGPESSGSETEPELEDREFLQPGEGADFVPDSLPKDEELALGEDCLLVEPNLEAARDQTSEATAKQQQQQRGFVKRDVSPKYKYNEPVRKKAEREALKGIQCQQCKMFYDAVVTKDAHGVMKNRCQEHHEVVSRHRYKYAPPATPEGFWNIGFD